MADVVIAEDLMGLWAQAQIDKEKPWHWMQIQPRTIISLIERTSGAEAALAADAKATAEVNEIVGKYMNEAETLRARVAELEADNQRISANYVELECRYEAATSKLEAEVERLSRPVSDEEWLTLCSGDHVDEADVQRRDMDALIVARLEQNKNSPHAEREGRG